MTHTRLRIWPTRLEWSAAVAEYRVPGAVLLCFLVSGLVAQLSPTLGGMMARAIWPALLGYKLTLGAFFIVTVLLFQRWRHRGDDGQWIAGRAGWRAALGEWQAERPIGPRIARVVVTCVLVGVGVTVFGAWKGVIPRLHPFAWDRSLAGIDARIHGRLPWEYLPAWVTSPIGSWAAERVYLTFLPMLTLMTCWAAWREDEFVRRRFFLSFVLAWFVLGVLLATIFSSAGPAFYGRVTGLPDPYAVLLARLHAVPAEWTGAAELQDALWHSHVMGRAHVYDAISAMPSLHVAVPTLYALAAPRRWQRLLLAAYAILIWIVTVALGWHYAVDGYVAAAGMGLIWCFSGWVVRRQMRRKVLASPTIAVFHASAEPSRLQAGSTC